MWVVVGVVILIGVGVWGVNTKWGRIISLKRGYPLVNPITTVDSLECQEYLWGHLHTSNSVFGQESRGWTSEQYEGLVQVVRAGDKLSIKGSSHSGMGGEFTLLTNVSEPRLIAYQLGDERSYFSQGQMLLIDKASGQMTLYLTQNYAEGVMGDQVIYTCKQKENPSVSDFDKATNVVGSITEVGKIKDRVLANGAKPYFSDDGEDSNGGCYLVSLHESFEDGHTNRIETFCVDLQTKVVTVDDVVNAKRISLPEWQRRAKEYWGF